MRHEVPRRSAPRAVRPSPPGTDAGKTHRILSPAAVAAFAQQLDGARYTGGFDLGDTLALARSARGEDPFGLRGEFLQLVELARSLQTPLARNP